MRRTIHSEGQQRLQELLIDARHRAKLTQDELAGRIDEYQSFVAKYENGERRLDVIEFIEICRALGTDPSRILRHLIKLTS